MDVVALLLGACVTQEGYAGVVEMHVTEESFTNWGRVEQGSVKKASRVKYRPPSSMRPEQHNGLRFVR